MAFKINISDKGKTCKLETESEILIGKKIGQKIKGEEVQSDLAGYILQITGTSDSSGFPGFKEVEGTGLTRQLLTYGKGMHKKPKGLSKKPNKKPRGLRLRKTVRGNTISIDTIQINLKVIKAGEKKLDDVLKPTTAEETEKPEEEPETPKEQAEQKEETKHEEAKNE